MTDAYTEQTTASAMHAKTATIQDSELIQSAPEYNWDFVKSGTSCGCLGFVLRLVLIACCGSFLFGFNISLLNTALPAINSSYQMCGPQTTSTVFFLKKNRIDPVEAKRLCEAMEDCKSQCDFTGPQVTCKGGYVDFSCDNLKWFNAFLNCAVLIGGAVGSVSAGRFIKYGRRTLLIINMFIYVIGVISSVCANSFSALLWARLIVGYGVGVSSAAAPTYISEMTPQNKRGAYGVFHQLAVTVGILIPMLLGLALKDPRQFDIDWTPPFFQEFWWRFMLGLGLVPAVIGAYILTYIYSFETPVWYVEQKRYKDASQLLEKIYDKADVREELNFCIDSVRIGIEARKGGLTLMSAMKNPEYFRVILIGIGLAAFQQFGGINCFMTSSSDLFRRAGLDNQMQIVMSIVMAAINVLMTFPTIPLIERMGRKSLLLAGSTMQFIFVVPAAVSYLLESNGGADPTEITKILSIIAVLGFVLSFAVAFGPIVWVYLFEIYPMEIRDTAATTATCFNWISGIIMVFLVMVIRNQISFMLFAVIQLIATLFILFFMKETKGLPLGDSPYISKQTKLHV